MSSVIFSFTDITGGYGSGKVIELISGNVHRGEALCILGRNGVGKSTLLRLLFSFLPLHKGTIVYNGENITALPPSQKSRIGISLCPQERVVFDNLTVWENLVIMQSDKELRDFQMYFDYFPILRERLSQLAGTLSGGQKKILAFVRTLSEMKPLVILDEPSEGVQLENIINMQAIIEERKKTGTSFLVVEQNLAFAENIADSYLVMDQGHTVLSGPKNEFSRTDLIEHLRV